MRAKYIDLMRLLPTLRLPVLRLPSRCRVCHTWPSAPVCDACVTRFTQVQQRCDRCALPITGSATTCGTCLLRPPPLDTCMAAVPYSYPWSNLIASFKFQQEVGYARQMAQIMRSTPWVEASIDQAEWIVPMPLSGIRLRERGYNQAWELAKHLVGRQARHKLRADLLLRIAHTPPQPGLPRAERLRNVSQAFAVNPLLADQITSRRIALVDDVMTSGASVFSAANTLKQAGAQQVSALIFARTDAPESPHNQA